MREQLTDRDLRQIVFHTTYWLYSFATADAAWMKKPGQVVYQLMPDLSDDGFFDWYCDKRPDHQFFTTKQECVLQFLKYWYIWKEQWINTYNTQL